ncbi:MAG: hypothetical protein AAF694_21980 [Bacteroidota bacterium]
MKAIRNILILWVGFWPTVQMAQTQIDNASDYHNVLVDQHNLLTKSKLNYAYLVLQENSIEVLDSVRGEVASGIEQSLQSLEELGAYNGDDAFRATAMGTFKGYLEVFSVDIPALLEKRSERFSSVKNLSSYFKAEEEVDGKLAEAERVFIQAKNLFSQRNKLQVSRDGSGDLTSQAEKVNAYKNYSRKVFLQYFSIAKLNADLWKYYDNQDHMRADLMRQEILLKANKVIKRVRRMPAFDGEEGYKNAVINLLTKYQILAAKDYKQLIVFQEKLEEPGAVTSAEEVDYYNKMVDRHNDIISDYNQEVPQLLEKMEFQQKILAEKVLPLSGIPKQVPELEGSR